MLLHSGASTFTTSICLNTAPPTLRGVASPSVTRQSFSGWYRCYIAPTKDSLGRFWGVQTKTDFVCEGSNKAREHLGHEHKGVAATNTERREMNKLSTGEGNGNPLQCSCLENPRDRGAWWAAIYGVAQSRTRLKQLSSNST